MIPPVEHNRRSKNLTEEDLTNIVHAINKSRIHECRFTTIEEEDLRAAVDFYKNFNSIINDSKKTVRRTLLILMLTAICGLVFTGFLLKVRGEG